MDGDMTGQYEYDADESCRSVRKGARARKPPARFAEYVTPNPTVSRPPNSRNLDADESRPHTSSPTSASSSSSSFGRPSPSNAPKSNGRSVRGPASDSASGGAGNSTSSLACGSDPTDGQEVLTCGTSFPFAKPLSGPPDTGVSDPARSSKGKDKLTAWLASAIRPQNPTGSATTRALVPTSGKRGSLKEIMRRLNSRQGNTKSYGQRTRGKSRSSTEKKRRENRAGGLQSPPQGACLGSMDSHGKSGAKDEKFVEYEDEFGRLIKRRKGGVTPTGKPVQRDRGGDRIADEPANAARNDSLGRRGGGLHEESEGQKACPPGASELELSTDVLIDTNKLLDFPGDSCLLKPEELTEGFGLDDLGMGRFDEEGAPPGYGVQKGLDGDVEKDANGFVVEKALWDREDVNVNGTFGKIDDGLVTNGQSEQASDGGVDSRGVDQDFDGSADEEDEEVMSPSRDDEEDGLSGGDQSLNLANPSLDADSPNGPSTDVRSVADWIEDFRSYASKLSSGSKATPVSDLFTQYPELAGVSAWTKYWTWKSSGKKPIETTPTRKRAWNARDPAVQSARRALFQEGQTSRRVESAAGDGGWGRDLHPWLKEVACKVQNLPTEQRALIWQRAQKMMLNTALESLPRHLNKTLKIGADGGQDSGADTDSEEQEPLIRYTSGVSYVLPTESRQDGVSHKMTVLPHTVIQPPGLKKVSTKHVKAAIDTIKHKGVKVLRMPVRDDYCVKEYLLHPHRRKSLIKSVPGAELSTINGLEELSAMIHDRVFLCVHYRLGPDGHIYPCDSEDELDDSEVGPNTLESSNVQIAIIVRKGIGGTCPLRSAARSLESCGILPLLLGTIPWTQITTPEPASRAPPCTPDAQQEKGNRECRSPWTPLPFCSPVQESPAGKSPYKLVKANEGFGQEEVQPLVVSSMEEWFSSVQATASCILSDMQSGGWSGRGREGCCSEAQREEVAGSDFTFETPKRKRRNVLHRASSLSTVKTKDGRTQDENFIGGSSAVNRGLGQDKLGAEDPVTPVTPATPATPATKGEAGKGAGGLVEVTPNSLRELLGGDEGEDEVDELINEMKSMEQWREFEGEGMHTLAMSKLRLYTLSCRLEMFVQQDLWKTLDKMQRNELYSIVRGTEVWLAKRIQEWNSSRLKGFTEHMASIAQACDDLNLDYENGKRDSKGKWTLRERRSPYRTRRQTALDARSQQEDNNIESGDGSSEAEQNDGDNRSDVKATDKCERDRREDALDDNVMDICSGLLDAVCPKEEPAECVGDQDVGVSDVEDGVKLEEDWDVIAQPNLDGMSEDFPSKVVKVAASAACLGSMQNSPVLDVPWPYYFISTRDCFTYQLMPIRSRVVSCGREFIKTQYYFKPGELPSDYYQVVYKKSRFETSSKRGTIKHGKGLPSCRRISFDTPIEELPVDNAKEDGDEKVSKMALTTIENGALSKTSNVQPNRKEEADGDSIVEVGAVGKESPVRDGSCHSEKNSGCLESKDQTDNCPDQPANSTRQSTPLGECSTDSGMGDTSEDDIDFRREMAEVVQSGGTGNAPKMEEAESKPGTGKEDSEEKVPGSSDNAGDVMEIDGLGKEVVMEQLDVIPDGAISVGVTTYTSVFANKELDKIEDMADEVQKTAQKGLLPDECFHHTVGRGGNLKRTKFFFGARYLWTREQLADPNAKRANGVRADVPDAPAWMKQLIENPLVDSGIVPEDFINSWALNMYHDGSEGIQSHFDDAERFSRPIYSLRLFSDSRLSFGTQLYGYTNGAFYVPMPRGCITVMEEGSYAANGVKHCVRPTDMTGKNAGMIMRRINPDAMAAAWKFHLEETSLWFKTLSLEECAVPFKERAKQKFGDETTARQPDEATVANIIRRVLDRCIRRIERQESAMDVEVKSVMEGLLRGVVRGLHHQEMEEKRQQRRERIVIKQVLDNIVRKIEQQLRIEQKEERVRKTEAAQVRSVLDNIIRRLERSDAESRKRRERQSLNAGDRPKRSRVSPSVQGQRSRQGLSNQCLINAAQKVLEKAFGNHADVLTAAQGLLHKFGTSWVKTLRQKHEQVQSTALNEPAASAPPPPPIATSAPSSFPTSTSTSSGQPLTPSPSVLPLQSAVPPTVPASMNHPPVANGAVSSKRNFLRSVPPCLPSSLPTVTFAPPVMAYTPPITCQTSPPSLPAVPCVPSVGGTTPPAVLNSVKPVEAARLAGAASAGTDQGKGSGNAEQRDARDNGGCQVSEPGSTSGSFVLAFGESFDFSTLFDGQQHAKNRLAGPVAGQANGHIVSSTPNGVGDVISGTPLQNTPVPGSTVRNGGEANDHTKTLVKDLLNTVAKAVAPLISSDQGKATVQPASETANSPSIDLRGVMADAMQYLDSVDVKQISILTANDRGPQSSSARPEEGKRKYNLVPWCVCFHCEQQGVDPAKPPKGKSAPLPSEDTLLWQCRGPCRRSFHFKCHPPPSDTENGLCQECMTNSHKCLVCGQPAGDKGEIVKCSMGVCGKFYHPHCVLSNPLTNVLQGTWIPVGSVEGDKTGMRFRCPQHYCRTCGLSGANIYSVACIRCPAAYHSRCRPEGCKQLSKKLVLCPEHEPKFSSQPMTQK